MNVSEHGLQPHHFLKNFRIDEHLDKLYKCD